MWLRNVSLKTKTTTMKVYLCCIYNNRPNEWYEFLFSLIFFYVYFVTNEMYVKYHYNEKLLKYFISKQWQGSMKLLILHTKICTCPKMFVALKSTCANKKGLVWKFKFLKSTR